jgi:hypothetical protein
MKNSVLLIVAITTLPLFACGEKRHSLTKDELTSVNGASRTFFSAQAASGKQGQFLSCSGIDSDNDGNVTCTGQIPNNDGNMVYQEALCSYGEAAGCKRK